jgi:large subunit ribosomal protein L5
MARLWEKYRDEIRSALAAELGRENPMEIPRLEKIVVSMGVGVATQDRKCMESAARELAQITGQKPLICKARKSVSNFKVRKGVEIGLKVTLRRERMYEFLDRLINVAVPRVRDFRGLLPSSFDGRGNYSMGLGEQTVFPEINPDKVTRQQGMNITLITSAENDAEGRRLLSMLGMPFRN